MGKHVGAHGDRGTRRESAISPAPRRRTDYGGKTGHPRAEQRQRGLSDQEIAVKLGLEVHVVREIRVVAERDFYPIDEWEKAIEFKDKACRAFAKHGNSYVFKYRHELD